MVLDQVVTRAVPIIGTVLKYWLEVMRSGLKGEWKNGKYKNISFHTAIKWVTWCWDKMEISEVPAPLVTQGLCSGVGTQRVVVLAWLLHGISPIFCMTAWLQAIHLLMVVASVGEMLILYFCLQLLYPCLSCLVTEIETHLVCLFLCILSFFPAGMICTGYFLDKLIWNRT